MYLMVIGETVADPCASSSFLSTHSPLSRASLAYSIASESHTLNCYLTARNRNGCNGYFSM